MTKKRILLASVAVVALGAVAAVAATGHRGFHHGRGGHGPGEVLGMGGGMMGGKSGGMGRLERLKALDADGDGAITEAELMARPAQMFARIDKNSDGAIDATDIEATVKENVDYMVKRILHRFDKDKDGRITREEFHSVNRDRGGLLGRVDDEEDERRGRWGRGGDGRGGQGGPMGWRSGRAFDRFDVNGDGVIDASEIDQHRQRAQTKGVERMTARLNLGQDGKLAKDAFLARAKARFADLDLDGDGRITDADLPPFMRGRGILK